MKKLAGTTWGADIKTLKQVYNGNVRPVMEYGSPTFATATKTNTQRLEKSRIWVSVLYLEEFEAHQSLPWNQCLEGQESLIQVTPSYI